MDDDDDAGRAVNGLAVAEFSIREFSRPTDCSVTFVGATAAGVAALVLKNGDNVEGGPAPNCIHINKYFKNSKQQGGQLSNRNTNQNNNKQKTEKNVRWPRHGRRRDG